MGRKTGRQLQVKAVGPNFLLLKKPASSRKGVVRESTALLGEKHFPAFTLRYAGRQQFSDYLVRRFTVSLQLGRLAHYYAYVFRGPAAAFYVGGAQVQHGSGNAATPVRDDLQRTVYRGLDASHVRFGTYWVDGDPVCTAWPRRVREMAAAVGCDVRDMPLAFPANTRLANLALTLDASTDLTDAMLNRVFGSIETYLHPALRNMNACQVPKSATELQAFMNRYNGAFPRLVAKMIGRYARKRGRDIELSPGRERRQQVLGPAAPPMFERESELLDALLDALQDENGPTWRALHGLQTRAWNDTAREVALAEAARREYHATLEIA